MRVSETVVSETRYATQVAHNTVQAEEGIAIGWSQHRDVPSVVLEDAGGLPVGDRRLEMDPTLIVANGDFKS